MYVNLNFYIIRTGKPHPLSQHTFPLMPDAALSNGAVFVSFRSKDLDSFSIKTENAYIILLELSIIQPCTPHPSRMEIKNINLQNDHSLYHGGYYLREDCLHNPMKAW